MSDNPDVQLRYAQMRLSGESHRMAEVLATRSFPGTRSDREFQMGRANGNQFETCPLRGDWYRQAAESQGVSTTGKFYHDGIASFPGDPEAWVSDRGDVLRVARERGLKLSGLVEYEPPDWNDREPRPDVVVDPTLIQSEAEDVVESNPGLRIEDVKERLTAVRSGQVNLNPMIIQDHNPDDHLVDFS